MELRLDSLASGLKRGPIHSNILDCLIELIIQTKLTLTMMERHGFGMVKTIVMFLGNMSLTFLDTLWSLINNYHLKRTGLRLN